MSEYQSEFDSRNREKALHVTSESAGVVVICLRFAMIVLFHSR